jgi:hypothetical protein
MNQIIILFIIFYYENTSRLNQFNGCSGSGINLIFKLARTDFGPHVNSGATCLFP